MSELASAKVAQKILRASILIGHIEKDGNNTHFKYKYQAWDDVLPAVRNACDKVGLAILPSMGVIPGPGNTLVQCNAKIIDTESGEFEVLSWAGESANNQDKGVQQAATSAMKYFLLKLFMIPSTEDHDTDADGPAEKKAPPQDLKWAMETLGKTGADCKELVKEAMAADKNLNQKTAAALVTKNLIDEANKKMAEVAAEVGA